MQKNTINRTFYFISNVLFPYIVFISRLRWLIKQCLFDTIIPGLDQWNFVLHPVLSSVTCDPHGDFVRKWIPELEGLPSEYIHQPWTCSESDLQKYNIILGRDYPERIVTDLEECRNGSVQDVTDARKNYGQGFIDGLNGRDRMVIIKTTICFINMNIYRKFQPAYCLSTCPHRSRS